MEIHLRIKDVVGMDDDKRHILRVEAEDMRRMLHEHEGWLAQEVVQQWLMKNPKLMSKIIDDTNIRDTIYMQEKARREEKSEKKRQRIHSEEQLSEKKEEVKRMRQNEQFMKSLSYRRSIDFYKDILGAD